VESVSGNGTSTLEVAYNNIYDITVDGVAATATNNLVSTTGNTSTGSTYSVSYIPSSSYYIDYDYQSSGLYKPLIVFDTAYTDVVISHTTNERSLSLKDEPLVDTTIPMSPLFAHPKEEFMYLSTTGTQTPTTVNLLDRPPVLYKTETIPVWVEVLDQDGNPIYNNTVVLATGTATGTEYATGYTNSDGYAVIDVYVTSGDSATGLTLCASASNGVSDSLTYSIDSKSIAPSASLKLFYRSYEVADLSYPTFTVSGYLLNGSFEPIPTATVNTSVLLPSLSTTTGSVTGDVNGVFSYSYTPSAQGRYAINMTHGIASLGTGFTIIER
jgi:hypothetical protein